MKPIDHLTNERLRTMFDNQFELVNYAIKLAERFIHSGRDPFVHHEVQNLSSQILEIIESGRDKFEKVPDEKTLIEEIEATIIEAVITPADEDEEDSEEKTETVEAM